MFSRLNRALGDIFRKPATTKFTIPYNSNHPIENKLATYTCSLIRNRMHHLLLSEKTTRNENYSTGYPQQCLPLAPP